MEEQVKKKVKIAITIAVIIACYYLYIRNDAPNSSNNNYSNGITMSGTKFVVDQNYTLTADKQTMNSDQTIVTFVNPKLVSKSYTLQASDGIYNRSESSVDLTNNVVLNYLNNGSSYIMKSNKADYTAKDQKIVSTGDTNLVDNTNKLTVDASKGLTTYQNSPVIELQGAVVMKNSNVEVDGTDVSYNRDTQIITSKNPMTIKSSSGTILLNQNPVVNLKNETLSGDSVVITQKGSKIQCSSMTFSQKTSTAVLTGNVHGNVAENADNTVIQSDLATLVFNKGAINSLTLNGNVNLNSKEFGTLKASQVNYSPSSVIATGSVNCVLNTSQNQGVIQSKQIAITGNSLQVNFVADSKMVKLLNVAGNARMNADNGQFIYGNQIITDTTSYFNVIGSANLQLDSSKNGQSVTYKANGDTLQTTFTKNGKLTELSTLNLVGQGAKFSDSIGNYLTGNSIALISNKSLNANGAVSGTMIGSNTVSFTTQKLSVTLGNGNVFQSGTFDGDGYLNIDNKNQVYGNHIACDLVHHTAETVGNAKIVTVSIRAGVGNVTYTLLANQINSTLASDNKSVNKMVANGNAQFSSTIGDSTNAPTIVLDNVAQTLSASGGVTGNFVNTQGNPQTKNVAFSANSVVISYSKESMNGAMQQSVSGAVMQGNAMLKTANGVLKSDTIHYDKVQDVVTGNENVSVNYTTQNSKGETYNVTVTGEQLNYIVSQNKIYVTQNVVSTLISDGTQMTVIGENAMFDNVAQKIYFSKNVVATGKQLKITNIDEGVYDTVAQNLKIYGYNIHYDYK